MEKGKKFYIIQSYMKIGARIDIACEMGLGYLLVFRSGWILLKNSMMRL